MSNKVIEEAFYKYLIAMIDEFITMYPDINNIKQIKGKLILVKNTLGGSIIVLSFKQLFNMYKTELAEKDENFFLNLNVPEEYNCEIKEIISFIRSLYKISSSETKDSLWKYITLFSKLSEKY